MMLDVQVRMGYSMRGLEVCLEAVCHVLIRFPFGVFSGLVLSPCKRNLWYGSTN
jgi:hypothetical protein